MARVAPFFDSRCSSSSSILVLVVVIVHAASEARVRNAKSGLFYEFIAYVERGNNGVEHCCRRLMRF